MPLEFQLSETRKILFERSQIISQPETMRLKISFIDDMSDHKEIIWAELKQKDIDFLQEYLNTSFP